MAFRNILVHAEPSPAGLARVRTARRIATDFGAQLESFLVFHAPIEPYGPGAGAVRELVAAQRAALEGAIADARAALAGIVDKSQLVLSRAERTRLDTASLLRGGDLSVLGPPASDLAAISDDVFHAGLFMSGRPCLVLPEAVEPQTFGQRILVAWKDCREAARALYDALPFLKRATSVGLVAVRPEWDEAFAGQAALDRAAAALVGHGVNLERTLALRSIGSTHETLLSAITDFNADMIVMGGYGRARFAEVLFGGVTRAFMDAPPRPILLSH